MSVVPGGLETERQPPMTVPLRHFVVGFGFLLLGGIAGLLDALGALPGRGTLAHVHLLLAGWVCLTIMGAMTQFVPVWSGVPLHSRRLAAGQLPPVAVGLLGFAATLLSGDLRWLAVFGGLLLLGFLTFVYNVGRTLAAARPLDVTERHFALALAYFVALVALGYLLALDLALPVFDRWGVDRTSVVAAHATLAVFGAVLTTVLGALYQLATMFTQTKLRGVDESLRRVEEVGYPVGVVALAAGRLFEVAPLARVGGLLATVSVLAFGAILARRLYETRVDRTPMLSRYAVAAAAMALWAALTAPAWATDPLGFDALFGAPGTVHLLVLGVIGFVVLGTLYHVVPFIVWVHRYSDRLGYERVPMIDDLYDDRIAAVDFAAVLGGGASVALAEFAPPLAGLFAVGGLLAALGFALFVANMALVIRRHSPYTIVGLFVPRRADGERVAADTPSER
ncbi:hypothetical protein ACFQPA_18645 [Halomarina halobia]|uniref:Cbb3-type cytochrome c oxidase subunit I n=1 Tax=Halomarina halobia TaxID=3033386 RepID=A0ABD6ADE7_9EURY|nr:hypothetical protein [Halomarina sp. PSR21]